MSGAEERGPGLDEDGMCNDHGRWCCPKCLRGYTLVEEGATPSQGLDAATVEPISDTDVIAFASQFYDDKDKGIGAETRRWIRAVRAALATEPHQHGGKGA